MSDIRPSTEDKFKSIHIIGRYPPPIDGQSLATEQLAELLKEEYDINRFSMTLSDQSLLPNGLSGIRHTLSHYFRLKPSLKDHLSDGNLVLWCSISAQTMGHWRDMFTVMPCTKNQPVVAVVHWGSFADIFKNWKTSATANQLVRQLDRVVVLSQELANQVARWIPPTKLSVIPNYVTPMADDHQINVKRNSHSRSKPLRVLFLSHMIKEKGCYDLLHGIFIAKKVGLSIEADFAGRWNHHSDKEMFYRKINDLNLAECITVHGPVDDREVIAELHRKSDIFVLPSTLGHEAQPLAIIEALSAGTPVIITQRPLFEALVNPTQGALLVPPHDPHAVALALQSLSNKDRWIRKSIAARKHYESTFQPEAVRQLWVRLIEAVHSERNNTC